MILPHLTPSGISALLVLGMSVSFLSARSNTRGCCELAILYKPLHCRMHKTPLTSTVQLQVAQLRPSSRCITPRYALKSSTETSADFSDGTPRCQHAHDGFWNGGRTCNEYDSLRWRGERRCSPRETWHHHRREKYGTMWIGTANSTHGARVCDLLSFLD